MEKFNHHSFFSDFSRYNKEGIHDIFKKIKLIDEEPPLEVPPEILEYIFDFFNAKEFVKTFSSISKSTYNITDDIIKNNKTLKNQKLFHQISCDEQKKSLKRQTIVAWEEKGERYGKLSRLALVIALLVNSYFFYNLSDDFKDTSQGSNFGIKAAITISSFFAFLILIKVSPDLGKSIGKLCATFKNHIEEDKNPLTTKFKLS